MFGLRINDSSVLFRWLGERIAVLPDNPTFNRFDSGRARIEGDVLGTLGIALDPFDGVEMAIPEKQIGHVFILVLCRLMFVFIVRPRRRVASLSRSSQADFAGTFWA
jgi:hypothetical protein